MSHVQTAASKLTLIYDMINYTTMNVNLFLGHWTRGRLDVSTMRIHKIFKRISLRECPLGNSYKGRIDCAPLGSRVDIAQSHVEWIARIPTQNFKHGRMKLDEHKASSKSINRSSTSPATDIEE